MLSLIGQVNRLVQLRNQSSAEKVEGIQIVPVGKEDAKKS